MVKISAFAVVAALTAIVATSPTSAHPHHRAAAYRGHSRTVVVDPNGLHAFARVPADPPRAGAYDPAVTGAGSAGYNAGLRINL
jgi:hypothetical protein